MNDFIDKSRTPWRCTWCDKNIYRSEAEARKVAAFQSRQEHKPLAVYKCKVSEGWHLTSSRTTATARPKTGNGGALPSAQSADRH